MSFRYVRCQRAKEKVAEEVVLAALRARVNAYKYSSAALPALARPASSATAGPTGSFPKAKLPKAL